MNRFEDNYVTDYNYDPSDDNNEICNGIEFNCDKFK